MMLGFFAAILLFLGCPREKKEDTDPQCMDAENTKISSSLANAQMNTRCGTMQVLRNHITTNPHLTSRMDTIEKQCQAFIELRKSGLFKTLDTITIPVVVHVVYNQPEENICNDQILSQITVLNQDFSKSNTDINQIPEEFSNLAADINIYFKLDSIIRVSSTREEWGIDDQVKFTANGGSDVVSPDKKLNIWVCTIGGGILGYAQFPGDNLTTDGIVVSPQFFGTTGFVTDPFNKGRTTTHEVGHWLNLRHIWGDGDCSQDDFVADTPLSDGPNFACPTYPTIRCNSNDMTMNYMDYVDDACMHLFTKGQKDRMRAVFANDGPRASFVQNP